MWRPWLLSHATFGKYATNFRREDTNLLWPCSQADVASMATVSYDLCWFTISHDAADVHKINSRGEDLCSLLFSFIIHIAPMDPLSGRMLIEYLTLMICT